MADQRYDEQQIGAILKRATEIQSELTPEPNNSGVTFAELQKVAAEVGIEPHVLEQAAQELHSNKPLENGSEGSRTFDCTLDGVVTDEAWEDIVVRLRQFVGRPGKSTAQGNSREWVGGWDVGNVTFTATTRGGKTRFRMWIDITGGSILAWVLGPSLGGLATLMTSVVIGKKAGLPQLAWIVALLGVLVTGLGTFFLLRRWRRKLLRGTTELFSSILREASAPLTLGQSEAVQEEPQTLHLEQR